MTYSGPPSNAEMRRNNKNHGNGHVDQNRSSIVFGYQERQPVLNTAYQNYQHELQAEPIYQEPQIIDQRAHRPHKRPRRERLALQKDPYQRDSRKAVKLEFTPPKSRSASKKKRDD